MRNNNLFLLFLVVLVLLTTPSFAQGWESQNDLAIQGDDDVVAKEPAPPISRDAEESDTVIEKIRQIFPSRKLALSPQLAPKSDSHHHHHHHHHVSKKHKGHMKHAPAPASAPELSD